MLGFWATAEAGSLNMGGGCEARWSTPDSTLGDFSVNRWRTARGKAWRRVALDARSSSVECRRFRLSFSLQTGLKARIARTFLGTHPGTSPIGAVEDTEQL